jgi:hypothetical protein
VIEAQLLYRLPWGTNIGVNSSWSSGTPISTDGAFNGVLFFPYGRNDKGRTPSIAQTDLLVNHPFKIGDYTLEASLNVSNLFDADKPTRIGNTQYEADVCDFLDDCSNDAYFGGVVPYDFRTFMESHGAVTDPAYGRALTYQAPRTVRLGLKFAF